MKKNFILIVIVFLLFLLSLPIITLTPLFADEYPYIPKGRSFEISVHQEDFTIKPYKISDENSVVDVKNRTTIAISRPQEEFQFNNNMYVSKHYSPVFLRALTNYYSFDKAFGLTTGSFIAGFTIGYDRYKDSGIIDYNAITKAGALTLGSAYVGSTVGELAKFGAGTLFSTFTSGVLSGGLFAVGAYSFGFSDRHTARQIATKGLISSSIVTGSSLILGTSAATTGIFSLGTLIIPYATGALSVYAVEKLFEIADKNEEIERVNFLLESFK